MRLATAKAWIRRRLEERGGKCRAGTRRAVVGYLPNKPDEKKCSVCKGKRWV